MKNYVLFIDDYYFINELIYFNLFNFFKKFYLQDMLLLLIDYYLFFKIFKIFKTIIINDYYFFLHLNFKIMIFKN